MQTFLALLLSIVSVVGYFVLATEVGIRQDIPVVHFLVGLAAAGWLLHLTRKAGSKVQRILRGLAFAFSAFLAVAFIWYTLDYSGYEREGPAAAQGQILSELARLELAKHDDSVGRLLDPSPTGSPSAATLLVIYRGYW